MKKQWSMIGSIILFLLVAMLSVLNVDNVIINFGIAKFNLPLIVIIISSVLIGALLSTLLSTIKTIKNKRKNNDIMNNASTSSSKS